MYTCIVISAAIVILSNIEKQCKKGKKGRKICTGEDDNNADKWNLRDNNIFSEVVILIVAI